MARARLNSGDVPTEDLPKPKLTKTTLRKAAKLLSYLKPYRTKFAVGMVFLFLSSLTTLAFPALLGAMIDAAQDKQSYRWIPPSIRYIGTVSFLILFTQSLLSFFRIRLFVEVAEKSLADIRRDSYYKLITLPLDFYSNRRVGELNSRLSADLAQIQDTT